MYTYIYIHIHMHMHIHMHLHDRRSCQECIHGPRSLSPPMLPLSAPSNLPKEVSVFVRALCELALNVPLRVPTRVEDLGGVLFVFWSGFITMV